MHFIKTSLTQALVRTAPGSPQTWCIRGTETLLIVIFVQKNVMGGKVLSCLCFPFVETWVWEEGKGGVAHVGPHPSVTSGYPDEKLPFPALGKKYA